MSRLTLPLAKILKWPIRFLVKTKLLPENPVESLSINTKQPVVYVLKTESSTDLQVVAALSEMMGLPSPFEPLYVDGEQLPRFIALQRARVFGSSKDLTSDAIQAGLRLLSLHQKKSTIDVQLVPITICWGRDPGHESARIRDLISNTETPSMFRKILSVFLSGRDNLVRVSRPVSIRYMANEHGVDQTTAHKLIRVARIHFQRQRLSATGPRLPNRAQMFTSLMASPGLRKAIDDEARTKKISLVEAKQNARKLMHEIAADYSNVLIKMSDNFLSWLWNKLYNGLEVTNGQAVRELSDQGYEIVYLPCHRSHMDYLLLSYAIYHQGMVPPHIAAGINLNFWPVGSIFRKGGAFFMRRSFKGNKLYSSVFREYLSLLFNRGYSVKFFTEGGRSRTGRLLPPKTGMLAMTVQTALRGCERPIALVPVYLGYEHVMEVSTYTTELKGNTKKKESVGSVFKAIRNLRDYGHGYVNFGEPILLGQFLTSHVPDWRNSVSQEEGPKPQWLTPTVNKLADEVMVRINSAAALNSVSLAGMCLLNADKYAMTRQELEVQMDFYVALQREAPYSAEKVILKMTGKEMVDHLVQLNKVKSHTDTFGEIISLEQKDAILMTYYRNNILHLYILPSLVASILISHEVLDKQSLIKKIKMFYPLIKNELFLRELDIEAYVEAILQALETQGAVNIEGESVKALGHETAGFFQLQLLERLSNDTLQRFAIVLRLLEKQDSMSRSELEKKSQQAAQRLSELNGINSPEFFDKKVLASFIAALREEGLVTLDDSSSLETTSEVKALGQEITFLLRSEVIQSIHSLT
ncbi:glycerol-3-phosphate 1-O-acyltransferase PlsB [Algicola sagamiensis]|uniref:glycerol-3-phosphate 1-O-acyltransferase PlsB n=1 Tax=Algicola sagamiensis TaxID=163869 RepID=UPI00035D1747|nr:glycerol-3-phosphate 1-O-acyltransferase PlsB [Algicola sagamiensis]